MYINITFTNALKQRPFYSKFLKEIIYKNRNIEGNKVAPLNKGCSMVLQNTMFHKLEDPNTFTSP